MEELKEVLKVDNLKKSYGSVEVLKGLNFTVKKSECIAIMGKSGCGKTTLLKTLGFAEKATGGTILFNGEDASKKNRDQISDIRLNEIGFVFQDFRLMDSLTVQENIMLPMIIRRDKEEDMLERCSYYAKKVGIDHLLNKKPFEISGGEKQRTAICRALINDPEMIYADEPTGNLDSNSGKIVMDIIINANKEMKKTIIMVTHDPLIASYCDRVIWLKNGNIIDDVRRNEIEEDFYDLIIEKMKDL